MPIDMYSMRTLLTALYQMKEPITFLLETFFRETPPVETDTIDIDIETEGDRMSAFCSPLAEGVVVENQGFKTNTVKPGYTKEKMLLSPQDLLVRDPGTTIYAPGRSAEIRIAEKTAKALNILMRRVLRREEWMAAMALINGAYTITGKGLKTTVDFGMKATHKIALTTTDLWTATDTSDIIGFMKHAFRDLIIEDSGLANNHVMIMGSEAAESWLNHPQISGVLDKRNLMVGSVQPGNFVNGAYRLATWLDPLCDVYVYSGKYTDPDTGEKKNLLPANAVLFGSKDARCERHFAAIQDLDAQVTAAVKYFPKSWTEKDPSARVIMLQSAPLPAPHQIDGFVVATVQAES